MTPQESAKMAHVLLNSLGYNTTMKLEFLAEFTADGLWEGLERAPESREPIAIKSPTRTPRPPRQNHNKNPEEPKAPSLPAKEAKLMCRAGSASQCACGASYIVERDLMEGMSGEEFAASFRPLGTANPLEAPMKIRYIDKCMMTNCPNCRGEMTLVLWGKRPEKDFDDGNVGSVGGVE